MKTLLISVNSKYIHSSLAVWYLKKSCKNQQDVKIIESTIKENKQKLLERIVCENADVIAFSTYIWNVDFVKEMICLLKESGNNSLIVLGGPEVSYNPEQVFAENPHVNYILSGEGEEIILPFLNAIENKNDTKNISGVCSREHINPPHTSQNEVESPYTDEYFEYLKGRITYIETSRGCPYSCSYCLSGRLCKIKFFSMDRVKSDIVKLTNSGTQTIKFVDRTFNCNPSRAVEIIEFILSLNPVFKGVCYHFEMAGDIITEQLIETLAKAPKGLIQIEVGVQSFNELTLEKVNRKTNISKLENNLQRILKNANIHVHMDLIAGLPCEDIESFQQSFNRLFKLRPHMLQLGFLKLLHGSPLESQNHGQFSQNAPYEIVQNDYLSKQDLAKLKCTEDSLERLYNSGRFRNVLEEVFLKNENAFEVFTDFGEKYPAKYGTKLEDYCVWVLEYFQKYIPYDVLFDMMKVQWICTNSSGKLPPVLNDGSMGRVLKELDKDPETKRKKAVKRAATFLKSSDKMVWVDYENKDLITGEYEIKYR